MYPKNDIHTFMNYLHFSSFSIATSAVLSSPTVTRWAFGSIMIMLNDSMSSNTSSSDISIGTTTLVVPTGNSAVYVPLSNLSHSSAR